MKDIFDRIIETLEAERELGTRTVEIDRALLVPPRPVLRDGTSLAARPDPAAPPRPAAPSRPAASGEISGGRQPSPPNVPVPVPAPPGPNNPHSGDQASKKPSSSYCGITFFTGNQLSPAGDELLGRMIGAMGYTRDQVRVNEEGAAKVWILMGREAMRMHAPGVKPSLGVWFRIGDVAAVPTYSPDFILKTYPEGSAGMKEAKHKVWATLRAARDRLTAGSE